MKILVTMLIGLAFAAPVTAGHPLGEPFTLAVGEELEVGDGGLSLGFTAITEDSRCPMDAYCLWEGNAAAALWAGPPIGDVDHFELNTTVEPGSHDLDIYRITLLWVAPYPASASVPIPPETYEVTLVVTRFAPTAGDARAWGAVKALYR